MTPIYISARGAKKIKADFSRFVRKRLNILDTRRAFQKSLQQQLTSFRSPLKGSELLATLTGLISQKGKAKVTPQGVYFRTYNQPDFIVEDEGGLRTQLTFNERELKSFIKSYIENHGPSDWQELMKTTHELVCEIEPDSPDEFRLTIVFKDKAGKKVGAKLDFERKDKEWNFEYNLILDKGRLPKQLEIKLQENAILSPGQEGSCLKLGNQLLERLTSSLKLNKISLKVAPVAANNGEHEIIIDSVVAIAQM